LYSLKKKEKKKKVSPLRRLLDGRNFGCDGRGKRGIRRFGRVKGSKKKRNLTLRHGGGKGNFLDTRREGGRVNREECDRKGSILNSFRGKRTVRGRMWEKGE